MISVHCFIFAAAFLSSQLVQPYTNPTPFSLIAGSHALRGTHASDYCGTTSVHGLQIDSSRTAKLFSTRGGGHRPAPHILLCKSATPRPGRGERKAAAASPPQRKRPPPPQPPLPPKPLTRGAAPPAPPAPPARATAAERLQWAATPAAILDAFARSPPPRRRAPPRLRTPHRLRTLPRPPALRAAAPALPPRRRRRQRRLASPPSACPPAPRLACGRPCSSGGGARRGETDGPWSACPLRVSLASSLAG
jgi:hypothetical protein